MWSHLVSSDRLSFTTSIVMVCCRWLQWKYIKLVPSFMKTQQPLTSRLTIPWQFSKPKIRLFENATRIQVFYRTSYALRSIYHGPVSVGLCVSVTSQCPNKMAKRRMTQTIPSDSPRILVFWYQKSFRNLNGVTPNGGAKCRWGRSKLMNFNK